MNQTPQNILRIANYDRTALIMMLKQYGLTVEIVPDDRTIKGSYWGDEEAGLLDNRLLLRGDTPLHSALHEACHYICMDNQRRHLLNTDASGDYDEENAVCYLQIILAGILPALGRDRMFRDMDEWGYTFRLGKAKTWFEEDAQDARQWLIRHGIIHTSDQPTFQLRQS
jgi:hypothetical protein